MAINVIRSKQIPDRIELVAVTEDWLPDTWGVRHRDTNHTIHFVTKEDAIERYEDLKDEFDIEDFFGFKQQAA